MAMNLSNLSKEQSDELACTLACLILHDDSQAVQADKIQKLLDASNNTTVEKYWPTVFANNIGHQDIRELLINVGGGSAQAQANVGGTDGGEIAEEKQEEVEEAEEEMEEGAMDLFGGDDDW